MLTDEQKTLIKKGLGKGVADTQIAESIGAKHMQVFSYRKQLGITASQVLEIRYDTWIRLLESGMSVDLVASLYKVKPESVLNTLYRKRKFSYTEAKKRGQKAIEAGFRKAMGLTAQDVREQRLETWLKLFDSGMTIDSIADLYKVKASTVRNALKKRTAGMEQPVCEGAAFDW
ncbi:MAG: hypothetical protein AB1704_39340 [Pseudomonadota bacterium]|jgi:hypothetical protein|uniref:Uncharacterized protein n=1 Tax=Paraburkholderia phytofirmans OLGA172 TaxID=1417228 RepID=A0A161I3I6_9BURK|nr:MULTISPECIES: hypothetical protein [Burkholderiaceae]ANB78020.1 hypothetical protein AYM40_37285 [Paraburkholderia phytofirmans OLGA172]